MNVDETKIEELVSELTLEEKIAMIHGEGIFQTAGVKRLGIPPLKMSDGPMGVRKEFALKDWTNVGTTDDQVSYLPSNSALAATWNKDIAYKTGQVLGAEARGRGKDVILAPGINIKRSPLCGRNFEYMSEDPKLIEELVVPLIQGIQENDVAACVKHFAANNQETKRLWVDTYMDERTLREIYFPGFYAAIHQGESFTLMGAYNLLYGEHCSQSKFLLTKVLREEWEYDGAVISDWGAVHDTKQAALSGLDIEMSVGPDFDNYYMAKPLYNAVMNGEIEEAYIDTKIRNILRTMYRIKMLGDDRENRNTGTYNDMKHREIILEGARESIILLKNEEDRLPIKKKGLKSIAVIGQNAERVHSDGGGSAEIKALYEISPLLGLKMKLGGNVDIKYAKGYYVPTKEEKEHNWQQHSIEREKELTEEEAKELEKKKQLVLEEINRQGELLLKEAVELAKESDEVIIIGGLDHEYDVEGQDRTDMELPYYQDRLIEEILKVNPKAVVVIMAGSPVEMNRWSDKAKAIVWCWYAGMEGGTALAEVLLGDMNPCGKLPETFPKYLNDSPAHKIGEFGDLNSITYKEGVFVGYRYYDTYDIETEFCFGHGLSYTTFEYQDLNVSVKEINKNDLKVMVEVIIKNTGAMDGAEVVQVYVADKEASIERPIHELKGFSKVFIKAGEEKKVVIILNKNAFGFYDVTSKCFKAEAGEFELRIGSSSRDIRFTKSIELKNSYLYI
ncbi:glycoside hydrolase family 3 C-terminal domain-containing protein [Mobilitalea sibirica]|uniref:Glycoside hydrolase family 3 C-terminal domain-containing protein n=2 Tax=Mobilitalea sibirica TaxID=1462919 RepID=A0A8J7L342_9FIRM|nr:glycoside hydrolase family 3 C-terminal domain-containing protein [Mobilitalea sibirica]MBH1941768.1 glycoside hydrolase family 3 C-terminal domain-containing protein [Mobilitalea sibirica]